WHISLSAWFRDYVYFPLGGQRDGGWRQGSSILGTFALIGLWHGASLHYVVWGVISGAGLIAERVWIDWRGKDHATQLDTRTGPNLFGMAATFSFICAAWVFFRASSSRDAVRILFRIASSSW